MYNIIHILEEALLNADLFPESIEEFMRAIPDLKEESPTMVALLYRQYCDEQHGAGFELSDKADTERFKTFVTNYDTLDYQMTQNQVCAFEDYLTDVHASVQNYKDNL